MLNIYHLRTNSYEKLNESELLPDLSLDILKKYITDRDQYDAVNEFMAAIQENQND